MKRLGLVVLLSLLAAPATAQDFCAGLGCPSWSWIAQISGQLAACREGGGPGGPPPAASSPVDEEVEVPAEGLARVLFDAHKARWGDPDGPARVLLDETRDFTWRAAWGLLVDQPDAVASGAVWAETAREAVFWEFAERLIRPGAVEVRCPPSGGDGTRVCRALPRSTADPAQSWLLRELGDYLPDLSPYAAPQGLVAEPETLPDDLPPALAARLVEIGGDAGALDLLKMEVAAVAARLRELGGNVDGALDLLWRVEFAILLEEE